MYTFLSCTNKIVLSHVEESVYGPTRYDFATCRNRNGLSFQLYERGGPLDEEGWVHVSVVNMTHLSLSNREPTGRERRELRISSLKTMATFRDVRIALLDSYMDGEIDDDEFLVLWQVYQSKNPDFPYEDYGQF